MNKEDTLLAREMAVELEVMKTWPPAPVYIPHIAALALIIQVQLALRHPENRGWNAEQGESIARQLQALFDRNSATYQVLEKGWDEKFDRTMPPAAGKTEVHNVYTLYEIDEDGNEVEEKMLSFFRPQDWGHPRWHYHYCRIEVEFNGTPYINHCHVWQEVERSDLDAFQAIASSLFMILIPGTPRELCSRSHLQEDDFWCEEWGTQPPYYHDPEEDEFL